LTGDGTFRKGSGRLELAREIASADNPLTARVIVNRVWMHHFGAALVNTASDFGARSDPPTHPELLDHLAARFMAGGWSLKHLHREMLLSAVYRQASGDQPDCREQDPENRLLWRMNRRRVEFEVMRDALLAVAGRLDPSLRGRPVDIEKSPFSNRRTVYAQIDRNNLPGLLRTFDFPTPDTSAPERPRTTVPQQALYGMNAPFVQEVAADVARSVAALSVSSSEPPAVLLFRRVLGRDPQESERTLVAEYLAQHPDGRRDVAQALLLANEFWFVD
jgi:hypothetical protein